MSEPTENREQRFVAAIIKYCQTDKGAAAKLRRADNPNTEYQSWEVLGGLGVDLEHPWQRLPFVTVAAAIARSKAEANGHLTLGMALARCYDDKSNNDQAKAKLRRLLACNDTAEACRILRPLLTLIASKVSQPIDFARLLQQLRWFHADPDRIRAQWAQEFYRYEKEEAKEETQWA